MDEINKHLDLNDTSSFYPKDKGLGALITEQVNRTPNKIAIKYGADTISYKSLNEKANQFAHFLIANGIQLGDKIGLSLNRSIDMAICFLAIVKSGAVYIPLDPNFPKDRLAYMLRDSGAKALITSRDHSYFSTENRKTFYQEDIFINLDRYSNEEPITKLRGNDLVYVLYTSGTTGKPKGVQIEHKSLINLLCSMKKSPGMTEKDVFLSVTTISFDIFELELYLPLISGGLLIIADEDTSKDGRKLLQVILKEKVTILQATPYTWKMLLESGWNEYLPIKALCGGETLSKKLAQSLIPKCKELWNLYGPTETTVWSTIKHVKSINNEITIGNPIDNTTIYLINDSHVVSHGEIGEICIGGAGVSRGYLNKPALTLEKFFYNPTDNPEGDKFYRTGDLGKITEDGEILCLGRIDNQIKIRGFRIETTEVEANLMLLDNINDAVIILNTDLLGNNRLIAYVTNERKTSDAELIIYKEYWASTLKKTLPEYMIPHVYCAVDAFPLTPNGKIDKKSLPEPIFKSDLKTYLAPTTNSQHKLAEIWTRFLGVKDIGVNDDFFDLGGHSIVAIQIMVLIESDFNKRLPISSFFRYPTIKKLAQLIDEEQPQNTWKTLVTIKAGTGKNPLYLIHGIGLNVLIFNDLSKNLSPDQTVYGLQALGLNGIDKPLDTFEEIAAFYIKEMLEENPNGPFSLIGYSMGGVIVLEMAKQLKALGKEVKLLGMIDTNLKQDDGDRKIEIIFNKVKRQFPKALFTLKSLVKDPLITIEYQFSIFKLKFRSIFNKGTVASFELPQDNIPEYMNVIIDKLGIAMERYKITPYDEKIVLFKAKKRLYYVDDFKYLGWEKYAEKGVVVKDVPGDHKVMLLLPNVLQFAKILQELLDNL